MGGGRGEKCLLKPPTEQQASPGDPRDTHYQVSAFGLVYFLLKKQRRCIRAKFSLLSNVTGVPFGFGGSSKVCLKQREKEFKVLDTLENTQLSHQRFSAKNSGRVEG